MSLSWAEFLSIRKPFTTQFFPFPGATRTIMVSSHIWWTDQIAFSLHNLGYNVLISFPLYLLYTDPPASSRFAELWDQLILQMRSAGVSLLMGGNASAMVVHPETRELLHEAAAVNGRPIPLVNWWWDEPRTRPPCATMPAMSRGGGEPAQSSPMLPEEYLKHLGSERLLNAVWDLDVLEELRAQYAWKNLVHLPLATLPEFWPAGREGAGVPIEARPLVASFLGNCHFAADWVETDPDPLVTWAREIAQAKVGSLDTPMQACIEAVSARRGVPRASKYLSAKGEGAGAGGGGDPWLDFTRPWENINAAYMHYTRNLLVKAAARHLGGKLALIGKGWEQLGLRANLEHAREKSGPIYAQSQICLNLFGGCVHGGMPLRPYDIGASGGLIVTHYQRELPSLFEVGKECLAFRNAGEMLGQIDRVRAAPREFNAIAQAGRRRVMAEHTWSHRLRKLMDEVEARWPGG